MRGIARPVKRREGVSGVRPRWRWGGIRLILDNEGWRNPLPDMSEDALPTFAIDAWIVEPTLRRPPLRHMTAAARVEKLALLASFAQLHAGLERLTPARIVLNVLESYGHSYRFWCCPHEQSEARREALASHRS